MTVFLSDQKANEASRGNVVVADGYGISLRVERGHLVIADGFGSQRRTRRFSRVERDIRRILILGSTGSLTLEALRWCADRSVAVTQLDPDNRIVFLSAVPGLDDPRIRRAQALASTNEKGIRIAQALLSEKISRQASVARTDLADPETALAINSQLVAIRDALSIADCLDAESAAANMYFGRWAASVGVHFAERDIALIPEHWLAFSSRRSPLMRGRTPRVAADPVNALLNFLYAIAEIECRIALVTLGLDPGLGVVHVDVKARDSLALDLLEVARPRVDSYVLELLSRRHFRATDFHETREGACRLMPVLAHELAETATTWATAVAPFAEQIAHQLSAGTGRAARSTPLTQANRKAAQGKPSFAVRRPRGELPPVAALAVTCRTCGAELPDKRRKLCATCWPVTRARLATERAAAGRAASAQRRALGEDPSNTEAARVARAVALSARKREQLEWESATPGLVAINFEEVLQGLSSVPLSRMREATGLSVSACSRIRSGALRPHPRHWAALSGLASQRGVQMDRAPFVDQAE